MTGLIPLTKGYTALVSDSDYNWIIRYRWQANVHKHTVYARTSADDVKRGHKIYLHVLIMQPPIGMEVHHKDSNGLNCQRENLRIVSHATNLRLKANNSNKRWSKYRGVSFDQHKRKFIAYITVDYRRTTLGLFKTEEEAALAYNKAADLAWGEDNFAPNIIR